MSKQLLLFRHAKSDWDTSWSSDHERPLAKRGIQAAKKMGRFLASTGQMPEQIISSTARRAVNTVELAASAGNWNTSITQSDELYGISPMAAIEFLRKLDEGVNSVMLVGHEPVWSDLASLLIGGGQIRFPTATLCAVNLHCQNWSAVKPGIAELSWLMKPKLLRF